jgi:hypothetical protein
MMRIGVIGRLGKLGLAAALRSSFSPIFLFAAGEQGFWLEPSDLTTMFQDRAGTTPVNTPGQTVGLRLDKSKGLTLGSELVTNGDFSGGTTGWTGGSGAAISIVSGGLLVDDPTSSGFANQTITTIANTYYKITGQFVAATASCQPAVWVGTTNLTSNLLALNLATNYTGTFTAYFLATSTTSFLSIGYVAGPSQNVTIDNISVKEIAGNHAVAPTDAARPTYGIEPKTGRRNLLEQTEEFNNVYWTKTSATVTPDSDGTADLLYPSTSGTLRGIERTVGAVSSTPYTTSIEAKAAGLNFLYLYGAQGNVVAYFNLSTGAIGTVGSGLTATITDVGSGYYRCSVTQTVTTRFVYAGGCDANGSTQATASGTNGILIRKAQLEASATATAYQRVGTAFNVTEAGVATVHYVEYNGIDDSFSTSSINFTATDKMSVFAGVRKLSDAAQGIFVELSASTLSNNGTFNMQAPSDAGFARYRFTSKGTISSGDFASGYAAPISSVLTGLGDISGDTSTLRVNGIQVSQATTDQGTGNFGNYPLFIGRRNNATLPFNGRDYGIIIVGKNASASEITNTESYLASNTSGVTL